jgi:hypothetical protein
MLLIAKDLHLVPSTALENSAVKLRAKGIVGDGLGQWYMSWINRGDPALLRGWSGSCAC